ncbi:MAG TPA: hypothetical protein VFF68_03210 [Anaerolineaceae bacterium]|nr:hypothetical protein [Anaerolineaceae bacterium]
MKTFRLVLLFAFLLVLPPGTGRAAATPPDGSNHVYLPLVLNGWAPTNTSYTRFENESENLLLSLKIDGIEQLEEPLAPGASLTVALSAGPHGYAVQLGREDPGNTVVLYEWSDSFVQISGTLVVVTIRHPALADVLSGFGDELYWTDRQFRWGAPPGLCFYADGSYRIYPTTDCFERGTLQETGAGTDNRTFTLLDESGSARNTGIYYLHQTPFFELVEAGDFLPLTEYGRIPGGPCPAVPACDLSTRASGSVRR